MHRFRWTLHNLIGHPLMEILWLLGAHGMSTWIHDVTLPSETHTAPNFLKKGS